MAKQEKLVILDGKALFHRAYHAIPHLTNKDGVPTNAVFGFCSMVLKAINDLQPDYLILAWDKAKTSLTQRLKLYQEYKAKRLKMPDDFYAQIPFINEFAQALAMPMLELDDYEADDIIGTLVAQHPEKHVIIVSNDRDVFQLLDGHVEVYLQRRGMTETEMVNATKVKERYGIEPKQIIELKALEGDTSDNIPGIAGVGEKTALDLLVKYHNLDGIYDHIDEIGGKLHDRLVEGREIAYLSRTLATIMTDAPVEFDVESARAGGYDRAALYDLFRRLDFKSLLTKIPTEARPKAGAAPTLFDDASTEVKRPHLDSARYHCVNDAPKLDKLIAQLAKQSVIAFDTETDDLDVIQANLVGLAFSYKEGEAHYVPIGHSQGQQLELKEVVAKLKPILEDPKIKKAGHNLKFDYQVMRRQGLVLSPIAFDTMIASFIMNPLGRSRTLSDLAYSELGIEMIPIEDLIGAGRNQISFDTVTVEDATRYAAEDADISWRLYQKLSAELEAEPKLKALAELTEWPLIPILAEMELAGITLDGDFLARFNKEISADILKLEEEIWQLAGERFNIASPGQLSRILFEKLGIDRVGIRKGKTGISTAASELEKMRHLHPVIELIFQYRELLKLKTTYVDALPKLISPIDGRIHTSYSQTIAQTGRLSSNNPNLQNIPVRTELGREIRRAFVAPAGHKLIAADYSQIELRVAAALAKDPAMIETFDRNLDLHQQTAAELYGVPLDKVTKDQRYNAKTINFGVLYGMSPHGLSVATGMSREEAAAFIDRYYELRPKLREYIDGIKAQARQQEYVETLFGRRRPCGEINSNNFQISSAAERMAVNVPIQGTAADIMKLAMIQLAPKLDPDVKLLLQIHDELIAEAPAAKAEEVAKLMKETMEQVYDLGIPLAVETTIGQHWGELK